MLKSFWFAFLYQLRGIKDKDTIVKFVNENHNMLPEFMDKFDYEKTYRKLVTQETLERYATVFTIEEWSNPQILKWCIFYNYNRNELYADFVVGKHYAGIIYYRTKEDLDLALGEAGVDAVKEFMGIETKRKYGKW